MVAGVNKDRISEEDPNEMSDLHEEASMSLEELLVYKYRGNVKQQITPDDGSSKGSYLEYIMSYLKDKEKVKGRGKKGKGKKKQINASLEEETVEVDGIGPSKPTNSESTTVEEEKEDSSKTETSTPSAASLSAESNGKLQNGTSNHSSSKSYDVPTSSKGKGIGKGLSNSIRKVVEKTPEELEFERCEAERIAKQMERKESLRTKPHELYKYTIY